MVTSFVLCAGLNMWMARFVSGALGESGCNDQLLALVLFLGHVVLSVHLFVLWLGMPRTSGGAGTTFSLPALTLAISMRL